ncbi:tRNA modification GTPase TrmE [Sphingomonas sp. Leaf412]|uniref:tRNA uridine-5-carboxymethylaminomethyl(34) synthesis GTPase MnmE n=1 Tax=Sphingomonas sp. Leaf412 TaxID=1736370 RepID=UPI0006FD0A31|nr:tRNA uridine-5-carboxymethylaminomethyl(34) synthesis GTPase MnmE [Sphingomonas sp. Leaf412]KQT35028.1 tRNA modification GTPase TrmE [Sphingomonas sp. Leaf412]
MSDTIYALSSGRPPAAIAILRISGPAAHAAAEAIAGPLPPFRTASLRTLRDASGAVLDHGLVLAFPGPDTATGEDLVEFHVHGGRAVVAAVERALGSMPDLRPALPGEFTRRALQNGRIDLAQAQGLADLLAADTEGERRAALAASEGAVGRAVTGWAGRIADVAARIEAALDYSDEEEVAAAPLAPIRRDLSSLGRDMREVVARPTVERLRDGALVVLAGPPNAGKSSLFNALLGREGAIVTDIAGTTRDAIEAVVVRDGHAYRLVDTAGLAPATTDAIEAIGIARAGMLIEAADLVLWFGSPAALPLRGLLLRPKSDLVGDGEGLPVSARLPRTVERLWDDIALRVAPLMVADDMRLHEEQRRLVMRAVDAIAAAEGSDDLLILAEQVRRASGALAAILGTDATEAMLDALFARFCVGK